MNLDTLIKSAHFDHSQKVAQISTLLAEKAGFSQSEVSVIGQAALYHDIGKSSIPQAVLNKPGPLTTEEFKIVKTHTENGYEQIMAVIRILLIAAEVAKTHHERPDGTGYMSLSGSEIHPYASLISVADVFDALISRRPYKKAWEVNEICDYFRQNCGTQFDRSFVLILIDSLADVLRLYSQASTA